MNACTRILSLFVTSITSGCTTDMHFSPGTFIPFYNGVNSAGTHEIANACLAAMKQPSTPVTISSYFLI